MNKSEGNIQDLYANQLVGCFKIIFGRMWIEQKRFRHLQLLLFFSLLTSVTQNKKNTEQGWTNSSISIHKFIICGWLKSI